ncbi:M20/M25/M40 family metallo-hydrolase [candidate division KSB3 bacterium]|uniref:M20/M25/M40 family metallo-hydrolase n=1 Tax=candidate division KSB3 bacterium TaxID=2044937 RepID=A0A9D5K038_9BACT|nr:M20/M25/M40 family metallo-hydrolase [candidate division KSB3 bacterium]MBD3327439.1 M20/M25/M40 family metallo-hydrolase [candidate division KSB3 bacterium]
MNEYIAGRYPLFLKDLETIVNIDSGSRYLPGIAQVADVFATRFAALGWQPHIHHFSDKAGPCLEVSNRRLSSDAPLPHYDLLCVGHMDTVFLKGTAEQRPFSIAGNRAFGPGVTDMKAGLVTVLHVAETLQKVGIADHLSVGIAFNSNEEIGSHSSRQWIESLARRSRRVFVFEPCRATGHYVLQRKGTGAYYLHCYGKAAHSGVEPERGINAVVELAHQILRVSTFGNPDAGTTVNVNLIAGGTKTNIIPDYATASVDIRIAEQAEVERITHLFNALPQQTTVQGVEVEVRGGLNRPPMVPTEATLDLWRQIAAIGERLGMKMEWMATGGGSDGNFTAAQGVPTIDAMGPIGGNAHRSDEYLELSSVVPTIQLVCTVCASWVERDE